MELLIRALLPIVFVLIGLVQVGLASRWRDRRTTRNRRALLALTSLWIVSGVGTVYVSVDDHLKATAFEKEMRMRAEETLARMTGGDSYTTVLVLRDGALTLTTYGEHPMRYVFVRVLDNSIASEEGFYDGAHSAQAFHDRQKQAEVLLREFDVLYSKMALTVGRVPAGFNIGEDREFAVEFRALNGIYSQRLFVKHTPRGYYSASTVTRAGTVLVQRPDDPDAWTNKGKPIWAKVPGVEER